MIIQNGSRVSQDPQPVGRTGDAATRSAAAASSVVGRGTVELLPKAGQAVAPQQASAEQLKKAVGDINKAMRQSNRNLEFSVDAGTQQVVVKLTDTETGEVIRQIPSEEALAISRSIGEFQRGLLLKREA
jgi:flagellar protein FlaG